MDTQEVVDHVHVWTDGSITTNPGGSIGLGIFIESKRTKTAKVIGVFVKENEKTTNQRAELRAVIHSLKCLKDRPLVVHLNSDSTYVLNGLENDHRSNSDLWENLDEVFSKRMYYINPIHVKGHTGVTRNELVDNVANIARKNEKSFEDFGTTTEMLEKYQK